MKIKFTGEQNKRILPTSAILAFVLAAIGTALRALNLAFFYDADIGYYKSGAPLPIIMNVFFIASVGAFLAVGIISQTHGAYSRSIESPKFLKYPSSFTAIAFLVFALSDFVAKDSGVLDLVIGVSSLLSAAYFALFFFKKTSEYRALLALCPVIWCASVIGITYFDIETQMNSPHKILLHITCIACMLYFVSEARVISDRIKKKTYFFLLFSALFFTAVSSIPSLIFNTFAIESHLSYNARFFALFVYLAFRTVSTLTSKEQNNDTALEQEE